MSSVEEDTAAGDSSKNVLLGLVLCLGAMALILAVSGWRGIAYIALLCASGAISAHLWQKKSLACRIIAVCLMPALLWAYFVSKDSRLAIKQLADGQ